jgi:hypothetical protein
MLAESIIASMVSLDVFLFSRAYRASLSDKSVSTQSLFMKNDELNQCEDGQHRSARPAIEVVRRHRIER